MVREVPERRIDSAREARISENTRFYEGFSLPGSSDWAILIELHVGRTPNLLTLLLGDM
jgi:hypothetical protein